ncbi:MAG TPA: hypothetical protein VN794_10745, partial [Methylomirabilota bacterium]|nr:hypothetical protein [Methylomirabilota bacterium]
MKRLTKAPVGSLIAPFVLSLLLSALPAAAIDGTWTQAVGGNQDWLNTANWFNGIVADGPDASAIISVDITADQNLINAFGKTVGHFFFQDTATGTAGGFGIGLASEVGTLTLDVSSGRSVFDVGALNTGSGKKISVLLPLVNNDGILKVNSGQLSLRANSPGLTSDFLSVGGLTDTRSLLSGVTAVQLVGGASFQMDFVNNTNVNINNLLNPAAPVTLGGSILAPAVAIPPPVLPLTFTIPIDGGGSIIVSGRAANTNSQTVASVTFNRGSHGITVNNAGVNSSATFDPTTFTRNAGAVVNFVNGGAGTSVIKAGGLVNDAVGIIGGYAISGTNWATVSGGG